MLKEIYSMTLSDIIQRAKLIRKKQNEDGCGGTVLPGEFILQKCPDFLARISGNVRTIMVGGTNGKTTTTSMIVHMLRAKGFRVFSNREGANKPEGIATAFGLHCNTMGELDYDFAVVECDELFLLSMTKQLKPIVLVLTNLYNDQPERLISVEHTAQEIVRVISKLTNCTLCVNIDMKFYDSFVDAYHGTKLIPYRLSSEQAAEIDGGIYEMMVNIPMKYNLENVASAASALYALNMLTPESFRCFFDYKLPFGRCENIILPGSEIKIILAKNQIALEKICFEFAEMISRCNLILYYDYQPDFVWLENLNPEAYRILCHAAKIYLFGDFAEDLDRIIRTKCTCNSSLEILSDEQLIQLFKTTKQHLFAIVGYEGLIKFNKLLAAENYTKAFWEE